MSKGMGIYVKFTENHSTNKVMSLDPGLNSENVYFWPNSILNFRKVTKFGGNWLKNKNVTGKKTNWGGWKRPPPPPQCLYITGNIIHI